MSSAIEFAKLAWQDVEMYLKLLPEADDRLEFLEVLLSNVTSEMDAVATESQDATETEPATEQAAPWCAAACANCQAATCAIKTAKSI